MTVNKLTLQNIIKAFLCLTALLWQAQRTVAQDMGMVHLHFMHEANGKPLVLHDSGYTNQAGETYSIKKLQYYLGHFRLVGTVSTQEADTYFLVKQTYMEEAKPLELIMPAGTYSSLGFTLGIDSIDHCSGAQSGALDPINNMFWTWNSGYVIYKLEGNSPASPSDLGRIEHHIGGYKTGEEVAQTIKLPAENLIRVMKDRVTEIYIRVNLDKYWEGIQQIRISENPLCMSPGPLARKIAENFPAMFSLAEIKDPK